MVAFNYGEEIATRLSSLFREHLVLAAQLIKAAKKGNKQEAAETEKKWYANANEIAAFLNSINPNWPKSALTSMLHEHLRMTKDEAVFRLSKKYKSDIEEYDRIEKQALEMADAFTEGIVKQFPNVFKYITGFHKHVQMLGRVYLLQKPEFYSFSKNVQ
jgi:hypothetical protein